MVVVGTIKVTITTKRTPSVIATFITPVALAADITELLGWGPLPEGLGPQYCRFSEKDIFLLSASLATSEWLPECMGLGREYLASAFVGAADT